jgi:hypothetical protein
MQPYIAQVPTYLAPLLEKRMREEVARIHEQDRATPKDHWSRTDGMTMIAMVPGTVSESVVQREMRRAG